MGEVAALLVVAALGLVLHRPLARVPENTLKFLVGVLLSAFFWTYTPCQLLAGWLAWLGALGRPAECGGAPGVTGRG